MIMIVSARSPLLGAQSRQFDPMTKKFKGPRMSAPGVARALPSRSACLTVELTAAFNPDRPPYAMPVINSITEPNTTSRRAHRGEDRHRPSRFPGSLEPRDFADPVGTGTAALARAVPGPSKPPP